ncbi:hypothetical protein AOC36_01365 [Erysipelothrix larvae]|uniref:O-antigen ligase-related domain-containing protein n=1 Tax=Erysipelothrix larvae TaxID=1514105 RepID=A0A109UGH8_9FIRM|nr:O-antigen ligase family protein [Erysipelothrix larvae]AMC92685.1 hypothetical protein AOC36_01365 [Erysipelothrix larvae]
MKKEEMRSSDNASVSINKLLIFVIYTFPFITLFNVGRITIQVETIVFIIIFLNVVKDLLMRKLYVNTTPLRNKLALMAIYTIVILSIISFFYTSKYITSQIKDITYWLLSLTPLVFIDKGRPQLEEYISTIMISSSIGVAILLYLRTGIRGSGFISSANLAGSLFVLAFVIGLGHFFETKEKLFVVYMGVNLVGIIATGSREALMTLLISIVSFLLISVLFSPKKFLKWVSYISIMSFIGVYILQKHFYEVLNRYLVTIENLSSRDAGNVNFAFANRLTIWKELLGWSTQHPFTPLGFQGLRAMDFYGHYSHNMFLQALIIGGLLGLIAFIIFLIKIFIDSKIIMKNSKSPIAISFFSLLIAYLVTGLVSDHFLNFFTWNYVYFLLFREIEKEYKYISRID